jgi:hypothetical protein
VCDSPLGKGGEKILSDGEKESQSGNEPPAGEKRTFVKMADDAPIR